MVTGSRMIIVNMIVPEGGGYHAETAATRKGHAASAAYHLDRSGDYTLAGNDDLAGAHMRAFQAHDEASKGLGKSGVNSLVAQAESKKVHDLENPRRKKHQEKQDSELEKTFGIEIDKGGFTDSILKSHPASMDQPFKPFKHLFPPQPLKAKHLFPPGG